MATMASRLAKIENQISLCDGCKSRLESENAFNASLLAQGVELICETATNSRLERCSTCGEEWRIFTGFDDDWSRAEEAALKEIAWQNRKAGQPTSREEWERFFAYNAEVDTRRRAHYGAEAFDKAYAEAGVADEWERVKAYAVNAPTDAERAAKRLRGSNEDQGTNNTNRN